LRQATALFLHFFEQFFCELFNNFFLGGNFFSKSFPRTPFKNFNEKNRSRYANDFFNVSFLSNFFSKKFVGFGAKPRELCPQFSEKNSENFLPPAPAPRIILLARGFYDAVVEVVVASVCQFKTAAARVIASGAFGAHGF